MRLNLLHHLFQPKVYSDAVSSDGYEPSNLISADFRERSKGFMAAHFMKPPIQILLQLPFPVSIEKIVLNPRIGSQVSSGFEVLVAGVQRKQVAHSKMNETNLRLSARGRGSELPNQRKRKSGTVSVGGKRRREVSAKEEANHTQDGPKVNVIMNGDSITDVNDSPFLHSYEHDITSVSAKTEHRNHFVSVAHVFTDNGKPFVICNNRFCERQPFASQRLQLTASELDMSTHNFRNTHAMLSVTHIYVRIIRICGSSVPVLKSIEIWGQPALNCPQEVVSFASRIQEQIIEESQIHFSSTEPKEHLIKSKHKSSIDMDKQVESKTSSINIPEEFIDPITCTIMTIPILLPSGHNVDSTTLEKHNECERGWGRLASDPFTGISFSDNYRPLPNSSLKVRIDRFLLMSNLDVSSFGRTVGRYQSTTVFNKSITKKSGPRADQLAHHGQECFRDQELCKSDQNPDGRQSVAEAKSKTDSFTKSEHAAGAKAKSTVCVDHESKVSQSLDIALTETLQGLQTFTRFTEFSPQGSQASNAETSSLIKPPTQSKTITETIRSRHTALSALQSSLTKNTLTCPGCKTPIHDQAMFCLPCSHSLCRKCLITRGNNGLFCVVCKQQFQTKDVVRQHTV